MGNRLNFRMFVWFHEQIKRGRYPTLKQLESKYEISHRTAQRAIEFMRDELMMPIEYSRKEKGYYYSDDSFELPDPRFTEKEIMGLVIVEPFTHTIPDSKMRKEIDSFIEKLSISNGIDLSELKKRITIKTVRYEKVEPTVFETVIHALNQNRKLEIDYEAKYKKEKSKRVVNPLHLLLYNGNWHLFAHCENKHEIRNFALSGIKKIESLENEIPPNLKKIAFRKKIEENYGIFIHDTDADKIEVVLKFSSEVADRVKNQVWFPLQKLQENDDGSITLTFPVTDFREVEGDILKYGNYVEVLHPNELRERIKETIAKMHPIY
jgi:predicted DNA-binding transcriptional regulator YafY